VFWAVRLVLAFGGAAVAASVVALLEGRVVNAAALGTPDASMAPSSLLLGELGVLFPMVVVVALAVAVTSFLLEPGELKSPTEHLADLRRGTVLERLRNAALAPLLIFTIFASCVGSANVARDALGSGKPLEAGLTLGITAVGLVLILVAVAVALLPWVRRALALGSGAVPELLDPIVTGGAALIIVCALFAIGVATGNTGGEGGVLGIFGVLKRTELDLRPARSLALIAFGAYLGPIVFARGIKGMAKPKQFGRSVATGVVGSLAFVAVFGALCFRASGALNVEQAVARGIEKSAPLGKIALAILRRATDRDGDGESGSFGGGDCDDRNPLIHSNAVDIPGNGIDEDCSGADTPAPLAGPSSASSPSGPSSHGNGDPKSVRHPAAPGATAKPRVRPAYNVILITIDTLRPDLGFLGYDKRVSPNLDRLAEKSAIFERAYALASYTGKSVGPFLIGKYPSETNRDWSHFNTYAPSNTFVAERAHDAGFRTFAGHCHWYFRNPTGLNQGMDEWDTSAIPPNMGDNDTSITSDRLADVALRMLAKPENVPALPDGGTRRFFAWFHFFDPHAQYVSHPGAPKFEGPNVAKNVYDEEVWFTDKHVGRILDYVASQPWSAETAIVVTADHGEAFGDHGMSWHGSEIWESLVRVPLIVYVPGGKAVRVPVKRSHIDLVPTLLDLMGIAAPADGELRGKSLLGDLDVKGGAFEERDVYIDMPAGPYNGVRRAVITGDTPGMKLISSGGNRYQLFDLASDPAEKNDLAADRTKLSLALDRMQAIRSGLQEIEVKPPP